jgi:hypothetical protein
MKLNRACSGVLLAQRRHLDVPLRCLDPEERLALDGG